MSKYLSKGRAGILISWERERDAEHRQPSVHTDKLEQHGNQRPCVPEGLQGQGRGDFHMKRSPDILSLPKAGGNQASGSFRRLRGGRPRPSPLLTHSGGWQNDTAAIFTPAFVVQLIKMKRVHRQRGLGEGGFWQNNNNKKECEEKFIFSPWPVSHSWRQEAC